MTAEITEKLHKLIKKIKVHWFILKINYKYRNRPDLNGRFYVNFKRALECDLCPMAKISKKKLYQISGDFSESDFFCKILKRSVWGENPACTAKDWTHYFANGNEKIEKYKGKMQNNKFYEKKR